MAESRVTSAALEVLSPGGDTSARVTSAAMEVLSPGGTTSARVTSVAVEVLIPVAYVGAVPTSYNYLGRGMRRRLVNVTTTANITNGPLSNLVSGTKANNNVDGLFCNNGETGRQFVFEFPYPVVIDEFTWFQDAAQSQGIYTLAGSNDGISYTDIVTGLDLGGADLADVHSFFNATYYKFYRLLSTSGSTNNSRWIQEIEFKCSEQQPQEGTPAPDGPTSYANLYGSGDRSAAVTMQVNRVTPCAETWIGDMPGMLDGVLVNNNCADGGAWGAWTDTVVTFTFPSLIVIDEIKWTQQLAAAHGSFTFAGSVDGINFTNLQTGIALGVAAVGTHPIANTAGFNVYRLTQTSGTTNSTTWLNEVEFKTAEVTYEAPGFEIATDFTDDGGFDFFVSLTEPPSEYLLEGNFADDNGFTAVPTLKPNYQIAINFLDETIFTGLITGSTAQYTIDARFYDESRFTATVHLTPADTTPGIVLGGHFSDDGGFTAVPKLSAPDKHIVINFTDETVVKAKMNVFPIGGPFFFQWANEGEEFVSGLANSATEDVFSFTVSQEEGDFATASIVVKNPRIGLLAASRKRWAFLSIKRGDLLVPIFYGRLLGVPNNMFEELVTLEFVARPFDFVARKAALAASLRTLPEWDPLFIDPDLWADDDTVLEGRTANWHIDRVTHEVTISDIISAEDGLMEFTPFDYFYDGLQVTLGEAPLRSVAIQSTLPWKLSATDSFDLMPIIRPAFGASAGYNLISSFTFEGLSSDWPQTGTRIGDGWTVTDGSLNDVSFTVVPEMVIGPPYDASTIPQAVPEGSLIYPSVVTDGEYHSGEDAGFNINVEMVVVPIGYGTGTLKATYNAGRDMGQFVTFTMRADVQDVLTLAPEADVKVITVNSNPLSDTSYFGEVPIGDSRARDFVRTDRGQLALQHLVLVARANLAAGTRVVRTTFQTDFFTGLDVTLRKGARIENERFPAGQAAGKIISYSLSLDGSTGEALAEITFASAVGKGGAYVGSDGDPDYIEDDYIERGHFERINEVVLVGAGDTTYTVPPWSAFDDGVNFTNLTPRKVVQSFSVQNTAPEQLAILLALDGADQATVSATLQNYPTLATIKMLPMSGGPYRGDVPVAVADLLIPKQIDLESET